MRALRVALGAAVVGLSILWLGGLLGLILAAWLGGA